MNSTEHLQDPRQFPLPIEQISIAKIMNDQNLENICHVPGVGWHCWITQHQVWRPDDGSVLSGLVFHSIQLLRSMAQAEPDPDRAARMLKLAQRSENVAPMRRITKLATSDPRISRNPLTFDPRSFEPTEIDPRWPVLEYDFKTLHGHPAFYGSRWAAKLRKRDTFARTGTPGTRTCRLWRLDGDSFVRCTQRWFDRVGPQEMGAHYRGLYGFLADVWLKASAADLAEAQHALERTSTGEKVTA